MLLTKQRVFVGVFFSAHVCSCNFDCFSILIFHCSTKKCGCQDGISLKSTRITISKEPKIRLFGEN